MELSAPAAAPEARLSEFSPMAFVAGELSLRTCRAKRRSASMPERRRRMSSASSTSAEAVMGFETGMSVFS